MSGGLAGLRQSRNATLDRIDAIDEHLDQLQSQNPVARYRSRDLIDQLDGQRANSVEIVGERDEQIGVVESRINYRNSGRQGDDHRLRVAEQQVATRGADIDRLLDQDLTKRIERIYEHGYDHDIGDKLGAPPDGRHLDAWLQTAWRIDQYRHAWADHIAELGDIDRVSSCHNGYCEVI